MDNLFLLRKRQFWCDERFHDIGFSFAESETTYSILMSNRMILTLCSPVFEAMFYGNLAEKRDLIPIIDIDINAFSSMLR